MIIMKKYFLACILFFSLILKTQAGFIPVEDVFWDINKNYKYYKELQELYNRWMIFPEDDGKFHWEKLLKRDEFVGISMEVICLKCIQPHTEDYFLNAYTGKYVFFDINDSNKYFYCVADADAKSYVKGYNKGYVCENGSSKVGEAPFCSNNNITKEEAYAVILRNSKIWTAAQNGQMTSDIANGGIYPNLSDDVTSKNLDGSPYTFYWYFKKALDYQITEYDKDWQATVYKLLEKPNNKIYPKHFVTKEEFLYMAYIALKANNCKPPEVKNDIALKMDVLDKSCTEKEKDTCQRSGLDDQTNTYDFLPIPKWFCAQGIADPQWYIWRFFNLDTNEKIIKYGKYIDNFLLPNEWIRRVYLRVIDKCGNTAEVFSTIRVKKKDVGLNVTIYAEPIIWFAPLLVYFEGFASGGDGKYKYTWDFADGGKGKWKIIDYVYNFPWVYLVQLLVKDGSGRSGNASVSIKALPRNCENDSDGDGVKDCADVCPLEKGDVQNKGCPIFEPFCTGSNCSCPVGYACEGKDTKTCGNYLCKPISKPKSCLFDPRIDTIYGNVKCDSCPCNRFVDYLSDFRKCDTLFPAITSPNSKEIYSRWDLYNVDKK